LGVAAIHAANNWKFRPFIKNGKPVKAATKLVFSFMINGVNLYTWNDATLGPDAKPPMLVAPATAEEFIIRKVAPVYPSFAVSLGIQGIVELHVLIAKTESQRRLRLFLGARS
jgi:hypothetical protein